MNYIMSFHMVPELYIRSCIDEIKGGECSPKYLKSLEKSNQSNNVIESLLTEVNVELVLINILFCN